MIYFCADDYGISDTANRRIENCLENGILNKVSVLPNGKESDPNKLFTKKDAILSLHINLVEGRPLSDPRDLDLIVTESGYFKYSFIGLFLLSLSNKRKKLEKQIYTEIQSQIKFWKETVGENTPVLIDTHQHTHTIPLIFKTLLRVIKDERVEVSYLRVPDEPLSPYILTPSLYLQYRPIGLIKQWLLKFLSAFNRKELKRSKIPTALFCGILFSGQLSEKRVKKLLPHYLRLSKKHNKPIEICFHPGSINEEELVEGVRDDFKKFYFSPWRKIEEHTLLNFNQ